MVDCRPAPESPSHLVVVGLGGVVGGKELETEWSGGRGRKLSALHTVDPEQAPTNLPAFPCTGAEGKRCWNREERAGPGVAVWGHLHG